MTKLSSKEARRYATDTAGLKDFRLKRLSTTEIRVSSVTGDFDPFTVYVVDGVILKSTM